MAINPNIKILVADDSETMYVMFKQILNQAGFENIVMAVNGDDGIKKVKEENPDIIISDWNMPKIDGLEFLQWLRSRKKYKNLPFIMATAQADKGQQIAIMEAGGNGHVPKPFDPEQIKTGILKAFAPETKKNDNTKHRKMVDNKVELTVAHIQITDHLLLSALKHRIENEEVTPKYFDLKTDKQGGWNPIQEGLENGHIDCAFVLAPIAMDLFAYDSPIELTKKKLLPSAAKDF